MEAKLENKLRLRVKALGGWAMKFNSANTKGVPDRIIFMPGGVMHLVELKTPIGVLSPQQKLVHKLLGRLGFKVWVIANEEQLEEFINVIQTT